ncbi:MAG TPA: aryl-sulfate sulfotransferase [Saprospiraceae bacterium]|nr:aryl-sulfate sulfotransferase [Saprospiraceae bacterium]HMP22939.1 aryl-sulfate sulfotransferase [Saprospiraceae bacterium]
MLNNCGEVVHSWPDEGIWRPGNTAYILENGYLVKTKRHNVFQNDPIWAGGGGAIVEIRDWNNNLVWQFEQNDATARLHHDIKVLPNGNIVMISWESKTESEAIQAGRNPALLPQGKLWPDYILEVNPTNNEMVWEWHAWDHLIQDFDPEKDNYGEVRNHPELIDLNWDTSDGHPDWMHVNAIDYNAELDQLLISVPTFHEVWVIDHSTTIEEAAGHTGGRGGRGGDLLYRWGNPQTYRNGTAADQKLFYPHHIHWVGPFLDASHPHYGKMAAFNNRVSAKFSTVNVFDPAFDQDTWSYPMQNGRWLPDFFDLSLTHPDTFQINSTGLSSVQLLPNGNVLICSGRWGYAFELTPEQEIVWEYRTPLSGGSSVLQGQELGIGTNATFKMDRYPLDYPAFIDKDMSSKGVLEQGAAPGFCERLTPATSVFQQDAFTFYPNPANHEVILEWKGNQETLLQIFNLSGQIKQEIRLAPGQRKLDITSWKPGVYFLRVLNGATAKLLIQP